MLLLLYLFLLLLGSGKGIKTPPLHSEIHDNSSFQKSVSGAMLHFNSSVIDSLMRESGEWYDRKQVILCGDSNRSIFIVTRSGKLYKSSDNGVTWAKMQDKIPLSRDDDVIY